MVRATMDQEVTEGLMGQHFAVAVIPVVTLVDRQEEVADILVVAAGVIDKGTRQHDDASLDK